MKKQFRSDSDKFERLKPSRNDEVICPELMKAMIAIKRVHPDRGPMQAYLRSAVNPPNETELCGVARCLLLMKPGCRLQLPACLDILRYFARFDVHTNFPSQWNLIHDHVDVVLQQCWFRNSRDSDMERGAWCKLHANIIRLVLPENKLQAVLSCKDNFTAVQEDLNTIVLSGGLGESLFGFAMGRVLSARVAEIIADRLHTASVQAWDERSINRLQQDILRDCADTGGIELLPPLRQITFVYLGCTLVHTVKSLAEQVSFMIACQWKAMAVAQKRLPRTWVEDTAINKPNSHHTSPRIKLLCDVWTDVTGGGVGWGHHWVDSSQCVTILVGRTWCARQARRRARARSTRTSCRPC